MHLTDKAVVALVCPAGRKDALHFDDALKGFALRLTAGGGKAWLAQYTIAGQRRRLPLGDWPAVTAAQARKAAGAVRAAVAAGRDPWAEREAAREAARLRAQAADPLTLGDLIASWQRIGLTAARPRTVADATARLRLGFADWSGRPAAELPKADIVRRLDRIAAERGVVTARRTLAYLRAAFGWAVKRDLLPVNPAAGIGAPGKEVARDRVLTDRELGEVWRAADTLRPSWCDFVRLLLLTLARREEIAGMTWGEVSADLAAWTIPRERTKNNRPHVVALPAAVGAILRRLPPEAAGLRVFRSPHGQALSAFSQAKARLDTAIAAARAEAGDTAPMPPWTFHDFRRTGVTALARMGIAPHVADKLLGHAGGTIHGVAAVYQRFDFAPEREAALAAWAKHVLACAEGREPAGNVVPLRA